MTEPVTSTADAERPSTDKAMLERLDRTSRDIEGVLALFPDGHPAREAARRAADALDDARADLLTAGPASAELEALTWATIERARAIVERARAGRVVRVSDATLHVLADIELSERVRSGSDLR